MSAVISKDDRLTAEIILWLGLLVSQQSHVELDALQGMLKQHKHNTSQRAQNALAHMEANVQAKIAAMANDHSSNHSAKINDIEAVVAVCLN